MTRQARVFHPRGSNSWPIVKIDQSHAGVSDLNNTIGILQTDRLNQMVCKTMTNIVIHLSVFSRALQSTISRFSLKISAERLFSIGKYE